MSPIDQLTARKKEIAQMINEDASNEEIAARLGISKATVKAHLTEIFRKLKITDRLQLAVLMAVRTALLFPRKVIHPGARIDLGSTRLRYSSL